MNETSTPSPTRFRRSERDKVIGGVAGGLGRYLGVDPVFVRLLFAVVAFMGGIGVVLYLLAWAIVPVDDDPALERTTPFSLRDADTSQVVGLALVVTALFALGDRWWAGDLVLPVALVGLGIWLLIRPDRGRRGPTAPEPVGPDGEAAPATVASTVGASPAEPTSPWTPPPPRSREPEEASGFPTARATTGLVAVLAGGIGIAVANGADISLEAALLACLVLCGAGLVVGAFLGRARSLVALAVPLVLALGATSAIDVPFEGGVGERQYAPTSFVELEDRYRLAVGELVLDLRGFDRRGVGAPGTIEVSVAVGSLQVLLPPGATVTGEASAGLGDVEVLGARTDGIDAERSLDVRGTEGGPMFELDLQVGMGEVIVR